MKLPKAEAPLVSIVMVTYGGGEFALQAIKALAEHTRPVYELIVVDNSSPDGTVAHLEASVSGMTIVANETNLGFARGCNQGAALARADKLCFLNPDAYVQRGWLGPLVRALERDESIGAAVPLFLHEDGRVQEAGSAVDCEGAVLAIGDGDDPESFEHRFRRRVDFGSAACLVVRADLFEEVGGFDPIYSPAYYEDVDLSFKLNELGFTTTFEPTSRVVHVRGGDSPLAFRLMTMNRQIFVERWGERLRRRQPLRVVPGNPRIRLAHRDAGSLERILVIDDRVPHHDRGSGDPRMAKLVADVADLWPEARVTLLAAIPSNAGRYAPPLLDRGIEVACADEHFDRWFDQRRFHYSVVLVSRASNIERFEQHLRRTQPQARRIYDIEALAFRRLEQRDEDLAHRLQDLERKGIAGADVVFCVTEEEATFAREQTSVPVYVLSSYAERLEQPPGFEARQGVVFFGGFMAGPDGPNEDAAVRLTTEVMPILREALPELRLEIVGAEPTPAVSRLQGPLVDVVGFVLDPVERLSRARVHVHPLRFGAGIKLKLIDTMAAGLPFVTTPVGAEGLGLEDLEDVLVAENSAELACLALALYQDRSLWTRVHAELLELVERRFGREQFRRTLVEAFGQVGVAPPLARAIAAHRR